MTDITFIFRSEWVSNISQLPIEQQDAIIADMVRYASGMELAHENDVMISAFVNFVKGSIDNSKEKYKEKQSRGETGGREKKVDDEAIYKLAKEGYTSQRIAEELGISKSTVDHSQGWKKRKEVAEDGGFVF